MEKKDAEPGHRVFMKSELEGLVSTLKDIFSPAFRGHENFLTHEADVLNAYPFLKDIFVVLGKDENWNDLLAHSPKKVEVALLPMSETDRKTFARSPRDALTLVVALPPDCIQTKGGLRWGAEMPCRFQFVQSDEEPIPGIVHYQLQDTEYPFR